MIKSPCLGCEERKYKCLQYVIVIKNFKKNVKELEQKEEKKQIKEMQNIQEKEKFGIDKQTKTW